MRPGPFIATVAVLALFPSRGRAQDAPGAGVRLAEAGTTSSQAITRRPAPAPTLDDRVQELMRRARPLRDRLIQDDRLRGAESVIGLGIAAYEASRTRQPLPIGLIGTESLKLGFSRQLALIHRGTGFVVEPAIGRRSFSLTFRKTPE
jgi:hypothetical protein